MQEGQPTILIVDDNSANIEVLGGILRQMGCRIAAAGNGQEALVLLPMVHPALILLDIMMPVMDGFETCRQIKSDPHYQNIPIIFLTALDNNDEVVKGFQLGAVDYVVKPFVKEVLQARLNTHLQISEARKSLLLEVGERKKAQQALQAERDEQVALVQQLKQTQAQLIQSEKLASVGQLAAGMAHEINNPLSFIAANQNALKEYIKDLMDLLVEYRQLGQESDKEVLCQRLDDLLAGFDLEEFRQDCSDICEENLHGIERIKKIVSDLRSFAEGGSLVREPTDLNDCISRAVDTAKIMAGEDVVWQLELTDIPSIPCQEAQIVQAVMTILVNAVQAMDKKGTIEIRSYPEQNGIRLDIKDNGCGIAQEHLDSIFDPFFTTRPVGQGAGLGLAVCFGIIKAHGGNVEVESQQGTGTTFSISLPLENSYEPGAVVDKSD